MARGLVSIGGLTEAELETLDAALREYRGMWSSARDEDATTEFDATILRCETLMQRIEKARQRRKDVPPVRLEESRDGQ